MYITKFPIDISFANTIDGYDTSYLFVAGSTGIYKYMIHPTFCERDGNDGCNLWVPNTLNDIINSNNGNYTANKTFTPYETISHTESIKYNVGKATYNKMQTYKSVSYTHLTLPTKRIV